MTQSYLTAVLLDRPIGFWLLTEAAGATSAADSNPQLGGPRFPGTVSGTVTFGAGGGYVAALTSPKFDGSTGYVNAGATVFNPQGSRSYSLEALVYPWLLDANFRRYCGLEATTNHGTGLAVNSAAQPYFFRGDASAGLDLVTGSAIVANAWYHLVGTYDGTNLRLYVNGTLQGTTGSVRACDAAGGSFLIGGTQSNVNGAAYMAGVAVYNYPLSQAQVSNHFSVWNYGLGSAEVYLPFPASLQPWQIPGVVGAISAWTGEVYPGAGAGTPPSPGQLVVAAVVPGSPTLKYWLALASVQSSG